MTLKGLASKRDAEPSPSKNSERRRALRRRVRLRTAGILLLPMLIAVAMDTAHRGGRIVSFGVVHWSTYTAAVLESALLGAALLAGTARKRGATRWVLSALFVVALTAALGIQGYFFQQYGAYVNRDVSKFATQFRASIQNQVLADLSNYLRVVLPLLFAAIGLVLVARRWVRLTRHQARWSRGLGPTLLVAAMFCPTQHRKAQASTPDILFYNALGGVLHASIGIRRAADEPQTMTRQSLPVPPLLARPTRPRNVLLLLLESVRADAVCIDYDPSCVKTAATNRLFPSRIGLPQLHALDSTTAITLAVLWSGLEPTASHERLRTQPLLFDYARAGGNHTAYLTSQNLDFGDARQWVEDLGVDRFCSATELDPAADLDLGAAESLLFARVEQEFATLPEPFFAVVQLSNVHYPYLVDPEGPQPFQPATRSKAPGDNRSFFNQYLNSVHQQDIELAKVLERLSRLPSADRTVIIYTSDHGEAFREHGNMGHSFAVLEEEIHVPGWIQAPPGTLGEEEEENLQRKRHETLTHVDLMQTMLDLLGVRDAPEIQDYVALTAGKSLLRPGLHEAPLALTNCAGVWSCPFENWGAIQGFRKVEAREWDPLWRCFDLRRDPTEQHNLGEQGCPALVRFANERFRRLPGRAEKPIGSASPTR